MWTVPRTQSFAWKRRDWVCVVVYSLNYLQYQHKEQNNGAKWDLASQLPVGWITFHVLCCQRRITPEFSLSNMNNGRCEGLPVCYCSVYCLLICFGVVFWNWTEVVSRSSYIIFFFFLLLFSWCYFKVWTCYSSEMLSNDNKTYTNVKSETRFSCWAADWKKITARVEPKLGWHCRVGLVYERR